MGLRKVFTLVTGMLALLPVFALQANSPPGATSHKGCYVNDSDLQGRYVGDCLNNVANGQGHAVGIDRYEGQFRMGDLEGLGTYTWRSGDYYFGEFSGGVFHGKGRYVYKSGNRFIGSFYQGKRHGPGTYTWADGSTFEGEYKNDKRNGFGSMTYTLETGKHEIATLHFSKRVGKMQKGKFVLTGWWVDDMLVRECATPQACAESAGNTPEPAK